MINDFLQFKNNVFSQFGEDGIIEAIFDIIGPGDKICCEFGAWDGIFGSNTRNLILKGWTGIMIEADENRYKQLLGTYKYNNNVICINKYIDTENNNLSKVLSELPIPDLLKKIDFLSIDIDGLDYGIFQNLNFFPRVICIEIGAGFGPYSNICVERERAKETLGQPFKLFNRIAEEKGYKLICYSANGFYLRNDVIEKYGIDVPSLEQLYKTFLDKLSRKGKEWLFLVNLGYVEPYYEFRNPFLTRKELDISFLRACILFLNPKLFLVKASIISPMLSPLVSALKKIRGLIIQINLI